MSAPQTAFQVLREVLGLHSTVTTLNQTIERLEQKIDGFIARIVRLEAQHDALRENLKSQILGDIKADIVATNIRLEFVSEELKRRMLPISAAPAGSDKSGER